MTEVEEQFDVESILLAERRISGILKRTPVLTCESLDDLVSGGKCKFYFKAENFQKTGSFKVRGSMNAGIKWKNQNPSLPGLVCHTDGNHGQGVAYTARYLGMPSICVAPTNTLKIKVESMLTYGTKIVPCQPNMVARIETSAKIAKETGYAFIHPSDNHDVMAGIGTVAMEFLEQVPHLDACLIQTAGGALLTANAAWIKYKHPNCKVFSVEPVGKEIGASLHAGKPLWPKPPGTLDTIADAIQTVPMSQRCFRVALDCVDKRVFTIPDADIVKAMRIAWERLKVLVEPTSAMGLAAAMTDEFKEIAEKENLRHIGFIISGGNVDLDEPPWLKPKFKTNSS